VENVQKGGNERALLCNAGINEQLDIFGWRANTGRREVIFELDDFIIAAHDFNIVHGCAIEYDFPEFDCKENGV
jgi:hypothetical protein